MNDNPETLRTYAAIFEMEWVDRGGTGPHKPSEACLAAARALRYHANAIETARESRRTHEELYGRSNSALKSPFDPSSSEPTS